MTVLWKRSENHRLTKMWVEPREASRALVGTWEHRLFALSVGYVCPTVLAVVAYVPVANLPCHSRNPFHSTLCHSIPPDSFHCLFYVVFRCFILTIDNT